MFGRTSSCHFPVVVSSTDHGVGHMRSVPEFLRRAPRRRAPIVILLTVVVALGATARPAHAAGDAGGWRRPVGGPVAHPFEQPSSVYGAGHRGVDFAVPVGTEVRAANDGVVSFAGSVAGTLHVTVAHGGDLRTSYSFLSSVLVRAGQHVARGDVVGLSGGVGTDHDGTVVHLGLRIGDRYVDPMVLFRPGDLTALVRLVPAGEPDEQPWSAARRAPRAPGVVAVAGPRWRGRHGGRRRRRLR